MPIVLHGDAAFPGQGVVAETLNLQALDGYKVGGTLHLIQNNQVGFTTDPEDARSTRGPRTSPRASTSRSSTSTPTTSPPASRAVRLAFAFRQEFGHDVLIDLIGYRRFGHNEADEPAYTQPEMYAADQAARSASPSSAPSSLIERGVVTQEEVDAERQEIWDQLTRAAPGPQGADQGRRGRRHVEQPTGEYQLDRSPTPEVETAVAAPSACASSTTSC